MLVRTSNVGNEKSLADWRVMTIMNMKGDSMNTKVFLISLLAVVIAGCNHMPAKPDGTTGGIQLPDKELVKQLPSFSKQMNEIEIAGSMNDVDPTWVLGSIVDIRTGTVRGLDNYISKDAKPMVTPQTEVVFKDFVENSLSASAGWLDFLKGQMNDLIKAEVSVVKTSKVTVKNSEIDKTRLVSEAKKIPQSERSYYGVIIGYVDFVLNASLFKDSGAEAGASGYGAKISGKWYSKFENTSAHHRVIAIWAPLPFVLDVIQRPAMKPRDLDKVTSEAVKQGTLSVKQIEKAVAFEPKLMKHLNAY